MVGAKVGRGGGDVGGGKGVLVGGGGGTGVSVGAGGGGLCGCGIYGCEVHVG